jgi:hypothetical protein
MMQWKTNSAGTFGAEQCWGIGGAKLHLDKHMNTRHLPSPHLRHLFMLAGLVEEESYSVVHTSVPLRYLSPGWLALHYSAWYLAFGCTSHDTTNQNRGFVWWSCLGTYYGKIRQHIAPLLLFYV